MSDLVLSIFLLSADFNPLCPRSPITTCSFFVWCNPRLPCSSQLADTPYWHPSLCKQERDFCETHSLIFAIVYYFWQCPLFKVWWNLRDAVNFSKLHDGDMTEAWKQTKALLLAASFFEIWTTYLAQSLTLGTLTNSQSFIFGDSNWKFCSQSPCRHPKTWHSDADISDLGIILFTLFFLKPQNQNLLGIPEQCICKLGEI